MTAQFRLCKILLDFISDLGLAINNSAINKNVSEGHD